jgi:hypothetical protein
MITQKIRRFAKKVFSSKSWVLGIINRFIPQEFGVLEDLSLNRHEKTIFLLLSKEQLRTKVYVRNYALRYEGSKSFVTFEAIEADGYLKSRLKTMVHAKEIEVDPKYIALVKTFLKA